MDKVSIINKASGKAEAKHPLSASLELLNKFEEKTHCNNRPKLVSVFVSL